VSEYVGLDAGSLPFFELSALFSFFIIQRLVALFLILLPCWRTPFISIAHMSY
jgi:hypothetical protein